MSAKAIFRDRHTFLPVVRVETKEQSVRNAKIAADNGADGIFLINHITPHDHLLEVYGAVKAELPDLWVGLNCLDLGRTAIDRIPLEVEGLWVDDAGINEGSKPTAVASEFLNWRRNRGWEGLYFGGVAFKYQTKIKDVAKAAKLARPYMDVITTSGVGTGHPADIEKIILMNKGAGEHPLGIASGITPDNVRLYLPYVNFFLVATGISDSDTELNPSLVRKMAGLLGK